ncbi:hypothetical protein M5D96_003056 [Drosophila gunungcola]|uniref:Uncharacterized protein n=1 Tax=Drosophila gunungcola TaxID=103775 RepID=A0A9P9Z155_9MUSC|nr:hypothetical protein M5D96_003056 [Drosophila gunungcola]
MVDKSSKLVDKFAVISGTGGSGTGGGPINMPVGMSSTAGLGGGLGGGGGMTSGGANGQKPVPMKLFAAWEVDRTPPNCIPRDQKPSLDLNSLLHFEVGSCEVPSPESGGIASKRINRDTEPSRVELS